MRFFSIFILKMKSLLPLFFLFFLLKAQGQNSLSGTISVQDKNQSMQATVYFPQLEIGTLSDFDGKFSIVNIPNGLYKVVFSSLGYKTKIIEIQFNGSAIIKNIALEETAIEMEEIIISTPFHKLQGDNVMKVERKNVEQLKAQGAITLAEGITDIPGVESITTGTGIGKPVIRGLSSNRVLTYVQGVRLEN